jgi:A/G-specific adenine glycosylase
VTAREGPAPPPQTPPPAALQAAALQAAALDWYDAHGRDLAFRRTADPWAVLVSEVMAQQTQAARAAEAWTTFIERYPTPRSLAAASTADVIRAWRGLGYNRRAVALRAAAIRIAEDHGGEVPDALEALVGLPGIGPYTARAVLAIAFGRGVAALDTNIRRVLDRAVGPLPGVPTAMQAVADGWVPADRPAAWTHALMDIGATICRKRDPRCEACPLRTLCRFAEGDQASPASSRRAATERPAFESTTRWLRGRILDRLRDAEPEAWVTLDAPLGRHDLGAVDRALAALASEGFLERGVDLLSARLVAGCGHPTARSGGSASGASAGRPSGTLPA